MDTVKESNSQHLENVQSTDHDMEKGVQHIQVTISEQAHIRKKVYLLPLIEIPAAANVPSLTVGFCLLSVLSIFSLIWIEVCAVLYLFAVYFYAK